MSISAISGAYSVDPYEPYRSMFAGKMDAADAAEVAEAADFDDEMSKLADIAPMEPLRKDDAPVARIEPAIEAQQMRPDALRREYTTVMEDLMELSKSMRGFRLFEIPEITVSQH